MHGRREFLRLLGMSATTVGSGMFWARAGYTAGGAPLPQGLPAGLYDTAVLDALPGKKPLIKLSYRPPNYETPVSYFRDVITPNDAFFVRYHLADIPEVDAKTWKVAVGGEGATTAITLTLADLESGFEQVELAAVCQCAGNRRGLFDPHVPGVEWGLGAMGNAVWKGVRLKDVLAKVGVKKEAIEVVADGADGPVLDKTPDFVKSIPIWKAVDENTLIATRMNGQSLPHFNGFPARLIVPGWTGTYWMKHLVSLELATKPFEGFWMKTAYRIPKGKFPIVDRFLTQEQEATTPITEMVVNSLVTAPADGETLPAGKPTSITGVAWDGGYGIQSVEVSLDGGRVWQSAELGKDFGRFSFRPWSLPFTPAAKGALTVQAKATNRAGDSQVMTLIPNPAGYHNNVVRTVTVQVA